MAHETNRYSAARKARDTGQAQLTGPIVLVQDAEKTPGFLFYAPFYEGGRYDTIKERRKHFVGLVYAPFVIKKLVQGTLQKSKRHVGIQILDGNDTLYDEHVSSEVDYDPDPLFNSPVMKSLSDQSVSGATMMTSIAGLPSMFATMAIARAASN